ncbi:hypothetical protein K461DRAFT_317183 [Myriangium duriaei CBS 260.36]|uniref:Apple domain-containing protein n=1 Tax=Myriangium duriaei CBS 260.36 TaxID=1168546 RepID=A0A9P4JCA1_9PEZI|nr:hypothetical protein K461DRAFT_317183 [Myriangium duriaei CBS 260.36]
MKSFAIALAFASTSLISPINARSFAQLRAEEAAGSGSNNLKHKLFGLMDKVLHSTSSLDKRGARCVQDQYWDILHDAPNITPFCASFLNIPPVTVYEDVTYTSTTTDVYSTQTIVDPVFVRKTPYTTTTVSVTTTKAAVTGTAAKRGSDHVDLLRRVKAVAASATRSNADINPAVSSFCSFCVVNVAPTVTETFSDYVVIQTVSAYDVETSHSTHVNVAPTKTATVTAIVTVAPSAAASSTVQTNATVVGTQINRTASGIDPNNRSSSTSSGESNSVTGNPLTSGSTSSQVASGTTTSTQTVATSPFFSCPKNDKTNVTQIVDGFAFSYTVRCGYSLFDDNVAERTYSSFTDCVSACSVANEGLNSVACAAVDYTGPSPDGTPNCFLKIASNFAVSVAGVDVAILHTVGASRDAAAQSFSSPSAPTNAASASSEVASALTSFSGNLPATTALSATNTTTVATGTVTSPNQGFVNTTNANFTSAWTSPTITPVIQATSLTTSANGALETVKVGSNGPGAGITIGDIIVGEGTSYMLQNETIIVEQGNFHNETQLLTFVYANGTRVDYAYNAWSGQAGTRTGSSGSVTPSSSRVIVIIIVEFDFAGSDDRDTATTTTVFSTTTVSIGSSASTIASTTASGASNGTTSSTFTTTSPSSTFPTTAPFANATVTTSQEMRSDPGSSGTAVSLSPTTNIIVPTSTSNITSSTQQAQTTPPYPVNTTATISGTGIFSTASGSQIGYTNHTASHTRHQSHTHTHHTHFPNPTAPHSGNLSNTTQAPTSSAPFPISGNFSTVLPTGSAPLTSSPPFPVSGNTSTAIATGSIPLSTGPLSAPLANTTHVSSTLTPTANSTLLPTITEDHRSSMPVTTQFSNTTTGCSQITVGNTTVTIAANTVTVGAVTVTKTQTKTKTKTETATKTKTETETVKVFAPTVAVHDRNRNGHHRHSNSYWGVEEGS